MKDDPSRASMMLDIHKDNADIDLVDAGPFVQMTDLREIPYHDVVTNPKEYYRTRLIEFELSGSSDLNLKKSTELFHINILKACTPVMETTQDNST